MVLWYPSRYGTLGGKGKGQCACRLSCLIYTLTPVQYTVLCAGHVVVYTLHTRAPCHTSLSLCLSLQCSSESRAKVHVQEYLKPQQITHTVKLINKTRKKEYRIEKLGSTPFNSLESIKAALKDRGGNVNDGIGYIEPGHGLNGKQKWLLDDDVSEMYAAHRKSREVMLYAYNNVPGGGESGESSATRGKRPKLKPLKETPPPKRGSTSTITQVEAIIADLKEKHGSKYDAAKYACWAHCIQNGKHSSVDEPPDLHFSPVERKVAVLVSVILLHLDPLPSVSACAPSASTS